MESLSARIWDEWVSDPVSDRVSAESELSGILSCLRNKEVSEKIILWSRRLWTFRRIRRLWSKTGWSRDLDLGDILRVPERHKGSVRLELPLGLALAIQTKELDSGFLRWPWIRGVFGGVGALYFPKRGYYFLFRAPVGSVFSGLKDHLEKNGFPVSYRPVANAVEVILRDQSAIVDLMVGMGLPESALLLEEKSIVRSMRDRANRLVNCDASNIRKSVAAAERQGQLIDFLRENGPIDALSPELVELIELRKAAPSASLSELGAAMNTPVSKSTVTYRWKKLQAIAESYGFDNNL